MTRILRTPALILWLALAACGGAGAQETPAPTGGNGNGDGQMIPVGLGRLNQDDISLRLASGDLEIRFVPLEERTLRLLAPDAYRALHDTRESRRAAIDSAAQSSATQHVTVAETTFGAASTGVCWRSVAAIGIDAGRPLITSRTIVPGSSPALTGCGHARWGR